MSALVLAALSAISPLQDSRIDRAVEWRQPVLPVVDLTFAPETLKAVGPRKAGLLCLPAGSVRGASLAQPLRLLATSVLHGVISKQLRDRPARVAQLATVSQIDADVRALKVKVCAAHWGLGDASLIKGSAVLRIRWTSRPAAAGGATDWVETEARVDWPNLSGTMVDLVVTAFEQSAIQYMNDERHPSQN